MTQLGMALPLEESEALGDVDEQDGTPPRAPTPGLAAGLALCIPSLTVIGLLYSLLK